MTDTSIKSSAIADVLAEEIIRGEHQPGGRLAQDHIAERFKCSHVPVREALQRLVQMELATSEPRRGVRVMDLSADDQQEVLEMRLALEPLALRLAVVGLKSKDISEIDAQRHACDQAAGAIEWEKANRAFHLAILRPSNRPRLLQRVQELQRLSAHRFHAHWQKNWAQATDRDHAAIVAAMAGRDADAACAVLTRHLRRR